MAVTLVILIHNINSFYNRVDQSDQNLRLCTLTEMVVVEMTSKIPSYRFTEGGNFSFIMPSTVYDKPFKTYEEMISILESRNIIIDDKAFAESALENFSYYGLINGYKNTFLQVADTENFVSGTTFDQLYTLHIIDTGLNNILFKYILYLERALKSRLSYLVAEKYGVFTDWNDENFNNPEDYLYKKNYANSNNNRINTLISLKDCIKKANKNPSILHYKDHKNHVPPWILTTNVPYGLTIQWYSILKDVDKISICNSFISPDLLTPSETKEFFKKALALTKEYRNKIAHGNRTFSIISLPQLPKKQLLTLTFNFISEKKYDSKIGQDDTLGVLLSLAILLKDHFIINNLVAELSHLLSPYIESNVLINQKNIMEILGLPKDFFKRMETFIKRKYEY